MVPGLQLNDNKRIIAGWGYINDKHADTEILLKALINEQPHSECEKHLHRKDFKWDRSTMFCASGAGFKRTPDSCEGDSGGPIMAEMSVKPYVYVVLGIVSWGPRCGVGLPGAYTNVSYLPYQEWIVSIVWPRQLKKKIGLL
ncbi:serine protease 44-like [Battus philenor]|uniref:serine protease 44-like n=1 Tax=Battus philenor TaxID=42288 RepID=UPI0035CEE51A